MLAALWDGVIAVLGYGMLFSLVTYAINTVLHEVILKPQDLKKRYHAEWAVVTGASSGIGRSIVERLCGQQVNVVMVALDDDVLATAHREIAARFPAVVVRKCGVDLSDPNFLPAVIEATKDVRVSLLFNNAGYVLASLYAGTPMERQMKNFDCNATSALKLTHHFLRLMMETNTKGLITFTSSSASFLPTPTTTLYGCTKSLLTSFAASLAPEARAFGVDVLVIHPSPVDTRFYDNTKGVSVLEFAQRRASPPSVVVDRMFASAGRVVVVDQGHMSFGFKVLTKFLDWNFLALLFPLIVGYTDDFKKEMRKYFDSRTKTK